MHDLRKKTLLESGKKASRKARSRPESNYGSAAQSPITSPAGSRPGSRPSSRPGSRYASEDEDLSDSEIEDSMTFSTNSASDVEGPESWADRLQTRVGELLDRKRSNGASRITTLRAYLHLLRYHFAESLIRKAVPDILAALVKSIKSGGSPEEQTLAMKALAVTTLTSPAETILGTAFHTLKLLCEDAEDETVKAEAIYTMGVVIVYGGGAEQEMDELLEFLTAITESDGHHVNAPDSAVVVTAALQVWAFVATNIESLAAQSEQALDAFVEQLDSSDADVQTSAGTNIALLFEISRQLEQEDSGDSLNLSVDPKYLIKRMGELSRGSKSISKKDRRHVRSNFASVITSLELGKGPGYSTAGRPTSNPNTGGSAEASHDDIQAFGYREKIKVDENVYVIESWATMARIEILKQALQGGFTTHFVANEVVSETLGDLQPYSRQGNPEVAESAWGTDSPRRKARGGRSVNTMWD